MTVSLLPMRSIVCVRLHVPMPQGTDLSHSPTDCSVCSVSNKNSSINNEHYSPPVNLPIFVRTLQIILEAIRFVRMHIIVLHFRYQFSEYVQNKMEYNPILCYSLYSV